MISAVPSLVLGKKHECVLCCLRYWHDSMHGWRASRRVQVCSRQEEDLVIPKRWFKQSVRDHTRAQIAFIAIQGTLPIEERRLYLICDLVVSYCLWLIDSLVNFLGSYEEHQTFNKFIVAISLSKKKKKNDINNNLKSVFCLLELFVHIQLVTYTRLSRNHNWK